MSEQQALFETQPNPWQLDEEGDWLAARVVFSKSPFGPYDYAVPNSMRHSVTLGKRVIVPLGRGNREIDGYCVDLINSSHESAAEVKLPRLKPLKRVIDEDSLISSHLMQLAHWISHRWHCPLGVTLEAIIPVAVRGNSNTHTATYLELNPAGLFSVKEARLGSKQRLALDILGRHGSSMTPAELAREVGCSLGPINALRKKGLVLETSRRVERQAHQLPREERRGDHPLNSAQRSALAEISSGLLSNKHQTILLHGVTGSGKTEVYIRAIQKVVEFGRQAIVLVPEISLTPQTRQRFCERFDRVAVLHSNLTAAQRAWHWRQIAAGQVQVVIGARSAVFAPVPQLGLIVLDEEHDGSFKQDQSPRYHAREVAQWRAGRSKIPLVLGSATPSLESWYLAGKKQSQLVTLPDRVLNRPLPIVNTIDLRSEFSGRRAGRGAISRPLHIAIDRTLKAGEQVILLLNRRGYSTTVQCFNCGHVVYCPDCAIAMTHHRDGRFIMCHYCDHRAAEPDVCPECGLKSIQFWGVGTQKLEQEVRARFPDAPCLRMDTDSMQRPGSHEKALAAFRRGEKSILVGTQMIAKGLDFPNVTLVGVINADTALHFHDFRASERTFALVTQVAGRTGRGPKGGEVLVQTFNPEHPAVAAACHHDFSRFAKGELAHRQEFGYPPYSRLTRFVVRGAIEHKARAMAEQLAREAKDSLPDARSCKVIGPAEAPISKLRGKYRFHFLLLAGDESLLHDWIDKISSAAPDVDDIQCIVDVDPQDLL